MEILKLLTGAIVGDDEAGEEAWLSGMQLAEGGKGVEGRGGKSSAAPSRATNRVGNGSELV